MENLEAIKQITKRYTLPDYIKPCVALMLKDNFRKGEGMRDRVAFIIATELRRTGKDDDVAKKVLNQWDQKNHPPLGFRIIHHKIKSAYKREYTFGCNSRDAIMAAYCEKVNKDFCRYFKQLVQGKKRISNDRDFIKYGWPKILKPVARQIYYMGLPYLEKRRGIKPGDTLFAPHREIADVCGVSLGEGNVGNGLEELKQHGLITYKPGEPYRWRTIASEISRIIPIPKPNSKTKDE